MVPADRQGIVRIQVIGVDRKGHIAAGTDFLVVYRRTQRGRVIVGTVDHDDLQISTDFPDLHPVSPFRDQ